MMEDGSDLGGANLEFCWEEGLGGSGDCDGALERLGGTGGGVRGESVPEKVLVFSYGERGDTE